MSMTNSCVKAIPPGLAMGPPACSFRFLARPSQNWATFMLEFSTVGELMGPRCQVCPIDELRLSLPPPMLKLWLGLQEINPDLEQRGSKNNFLPNSTTAGLVTLAGLIGEMGFLSAA